MNEIRKTSLILTSHCSTECIRTTLPPSPIDTPVALWLVRATMKRARHEHHGGARRHTVPMYL